MCISSRIVGEEELLRKVNEMEKNGSSNNNNGMVVLSHAKMILWMTRGMTTLLLWICVVQLLTVGEVWGPRLLKTWPSCYTSTSSSVSTSPAEPANNVHASFLDSKVLLPPKSKFFWLVLDDMLMHN